MLKNKTPSDKYKPKYYCCGEMLRAVLNGTYPLSAIASVPEPIKATVQCFVPGLKLHEEKQAAA